MGNFLREHAEVCFNSVAQFETASVRHTLDRNVPSTCACGEFISGGKEEVVVHFVQAAAIMVNTQGNIVFKDQINNNYIKNTTCCIRSR